MTAINPYASPPMSGDERPGDRWKQFKVAVDYSTFVVGPPVFLLAYFAKDFHQEEWFVIIGSVVALLLLSWTVGYLIVVVCCGLHRILRMARFIIFSFEFLCRVTRNSYGRVKLFSRHCVSYFLPPRMKL